METFASEQFVVVRLDPGDLALESIRRGCREADLTDGVVVSGIGTLNTLNLHYVNTTHFREAEGPKAERNTFLELEGAWEVSAVQGVVADGEPHLHVTAYDGERTVAGHLEDGCEVNVLGEVAIQRAPDLALTRRPDEEGVGRLERR
jgi:predicted DNA-binding protein with PD1-like motif